MNSAASRPHHFIHKCFLNRATLSDAKWAKRPFSVLDHPFLFLFTSNFLAFHSAPM